MTMNINLSPQLDEWVRKKVASGLYASASEVVRAALRLMEENERMKEAQFSQLQGEIRAGIESGPATPWNLDEVKQEGRKLKKGR